MTISQIGMPYRQVRTSLLVAALLVTFGVGLLAGLNVSRFADRGTSAAPIGAAALSSGRQASAAYQAYRQGEWADPGSAAAPPR